MSLAHIHSVLCRILNPMLSVILLYTLSIISWTNLHLQFIKCYAESYKTLFTFDFILTYTAVIADGETCTLNTVQSGLLTATENKPQIYTYIHTHTHISAGNYAIL
jgi:hypothetical protein